MDSYLNRPTHCVLHSPGLALCRVDLPKLLEPDTVHLPLVAVVQTEISHEVLGQLK